MGNDIYIAGIIVLILGLVGAIVPMLNDDFGTTSPTYSVEGVSETINNQEAPNSILSVPTGINALLSVTLWTPEVPFWINILFSVFRIMLYFIIFRNLWIGGGG